MTAFLTFYEEQAARRSGMFPDASRLRPLVQPNHPDVLATWTNYADRAIALLLYSNDVVVDDPLLYIGRFATPATALGALVRMRPLHDLGCITFIHYPHQYRHPSRSAVGPGDLERLAQLPGAQAVFEEMDRLANVYPSDDALRQAIFSSRVDIGRSLQVVSAARGSATPLATTAMEAVTLQTAVLLAGHSVADRRRLNVFKLAALELPSLNPDGIAAVRSSSESFAGWRTAINQAMDRLDGIHEDDENWQGLAREALSDELEPIRDLIQAELKKSTALAAMRTGTKGFTLAGVGAAAGFALGGDPVIAAGGAAAAKTAEVATEYVRGLRQRKSNRAILDLSTAFIDR